MVQKYLLQKKNDFVVYWKTIGSIITSKTGFNIKLIEPKILSHAKKISLLLIHDHNHKHNPLISISLRCRYGNRYNYGDNYLQLGIYINGLRKNIADNVREEIRHEINHTAEDGYMQNSSDYILLSLAKRDHKTLCKNMKWNVDKTHYEINKSNNNVISLQLKFEWIKHIGYKINIVSFTKCFKLCASNNKYEPRIAKINHFQYKNMSNGSFFLKANKCQFENQCQFSRIFR
eukprot:447744_1